MTPIELALTSLSEATAVTYHRERDSQGFQKLKRDATDAGRVAGKAREAIESEMGRSVVSKENYLGLKPVRGRQSERQKQLKQADQPSLLDDPE